VYLPSWFPPLPHRLYPSLSANASGWEVQLTDQRTCTALYCVTWFAQGLPGRQVRPHWDQKVDLGAHGVGYLYLNTGSNSLPSMQWTRDGNTYNAVAPIAEASPDQPTLVHIVRSMVRVAQAGHTMAPVQPPPSLYAFSPTVVGKPYAPFYGSAASSFVSHGGPGGALATYSWYVQPPGTPDGSEGSYSVEVLTTAAQATARSSHDDLLASRGCMGLGGGCNTLAPPTIPLVGRPDGGWMRGACSSNGSCGYRAGAIYRHVYVSTRVNCRAPNGHACAAWTTTVIHLMIARTKSYNGHGSGGNGSGQYITAPVPLAAAQIRQRNADMQAWRRNVREVVLPCLTDEGVERAAYLAVIAGTGTADAVSADEPLAEVACTNALTYLGAAQLPDDLRRYSDVTNWIGEWIGSVDMDIVVIRQMSEEAPIAATSAAERYVVDTNGAIATRSENSAHQYLARIVRDWRLPPI